MNRLPQEIEVWYVIPAIRRNVSICLSKEHGISYDNIAKLMGLTKSAISMYVSGKRAQTIKLHPKAEKEIETMCKNILLKKQKTNDEIQKMLTFIKKKKLHCEKCGQMVKGILHKCKKIIVPEIN